MKAYLGNHSATAQEASKKELAKAECHKLNAVEISKMQTQNLRELLKLDNTQTISVYEALYEIEKKMEAVTKTDIGEEAKMPEIEKWETVKTETLKEILTTEQFATYMNTIKNTKR